MQVKIISPKTTLKVTFAALSMVLSMGIGPSAQATSTTTTLTQANQSRLAAEAQQLSTQGRYADAVAGYESLAAQTNRPERDRYLLKAARNAQLAGDNAKTQALLSLVSSTLNPQDNALRSVIGAAAELHANQGERALAALDQIPLPLPDEVAADALALRVQALFAIGRPVLAVNTALERERILKSDTAVTQNRQLIWDGLKQAAATGRDLTPPTGATSVTAGWLALGQIYGRSQRDPFAFNRELGEWRNLYPQHPGSSMLVNRATAVVNTKLGDDRIALLLPLSGKQQAAGVAIRDGFIAAALQNPLDKRARIEVFDTNALGAVVAYQQANEAGATMIVGPLLKEDLEALAATQQVGTMTLALNALNESQQPPAMMFQFSLDPEEEAKQVAQRARSEGRTRAIMLTPANDWGQRMQRAFLAELKAEGGTLVDQRSYDPAVRDYVQQAKQLLASRKPPQARALAEALGNKRTPTEVRDDFDYIFLAAQPAQVKQMRPALRFVLPDNSIPIYATSDSYEPETRNTDLDGLRFVDMPWIINRDSDTQSLHDSLDRVWSSNLRSRSRLYAFGIDAFKLIAWLKTPQPQLAAPLRGATGLLALDQAGRVHRQADWAQIINGSPQLLPDPVTSITR